MNEFNLTIDERYCVGNDILGSCFFGEVVKGVDKLNNMPIACQIVNIKKLQQNPMFVELFGQSIKVHQSLDSPFIVEFYNIFKIKNDFYIFQEYCDNGNLEQYIKSKGPLSEQEAIGFIYQILAAFRILHSKSIIHRNLTAKNILMNGNQLKISDFFSTKIIEEGNEGVTLIGTPLYMAPEIQQGLNYGFEVDIFSLGVLIYFMLFNEYPFKGNSMFQLTKSMKSEQIDFNKNGVVISNQMQDFITRLLRFNRDERITWELIYQHPIIIDNMKYDISDQFITAVPTSAYIQQYTKSKFSNKKAQNNNNQ